MLLACPNWDADMSHVHQSIERLLEQGTPAARIAVLCHDSRDQKAFESLKARGVYVSSYEKMKGLEFEAVFLPRLNTAFATNGEVYDEFFVSRRRRRVYVAMTRARSELVLSFHGRLPEELQPLNSGYVALLAAGRPS